MFSTACIQGRREIGAVHNSLVLVCCAHFAHTATALLQLAAGIIQVRMSACYGLQVGVIAILHTFNGKLEFNSHVHTMVIGSTRRFNAGKAAGEDE